MLPIMDWHTAPIYAKNSEMKNKTFAQGSPILDQMLSHLRGRLAGTSSLVISSGIINPCSCSVVTVCSLTFSLRLYILMPVRLPAWVHSHRVCLSQSGSMRVVTPVNLAATLWTTRTCAG